jgi:probable HAF family extracellular repeat protein
MKSRFLMCFTAIALFVALSIPLSLAAQEHPAKHHQYKLVDLGTLGGLNSGVNVGTTNINNKGLAIAGADTSFFLPPNSNPWPCGSPTYVGHGLEWGKKDGVRDLSALPPADDNCSNTQGINTTGKIVGNSENGVIDPLTGFIEIRAVLWKDGRIKDLGTLGGNHSAAYWINDRGQVAGFALNNIPDPYSFFDFGILGSSNGTQTRSFLWEKGKKMRDLGTLGGPDAFVGILNERGQIVGSSYTNGTPNSNNGPNCLPNVPTQDPFFWEKGKMIDIGTLGGNCGGAAFINNHGQVVGTSDLKGDVIYHPFFWENGQKIQDLGTFGGDTGVAESLNDAGEAVGVADFPGNQVHDAFLWKKGKMKDLGNLGKTSHAYNINSRGQIVGGSRINDAGEIHAFLWENGAMVDLNTLIPAGSPLQLTFGFSINDGGEIEGTGVLSNGDQHAYVLIPCDESNSDTEGCKDDSSGAIAGTQNAPVSSTHYPAAVTEDNPGPNRRLAPFLGPPIRRYRTSGGGGA